MSLSRRQLLISAAAAGCVSCSIRVEMADNGIEVAPESIPDPTSVEAVGTPGLDVSGSFGGSMRLGTVDEVVEQIRINGGFWYVPEGRAWLTPYPAESLEQARRQYSSRELVGMEAGFVALYQKCPHLGCRVPSCATSQWFECPCHGSLYNQVGEKRGGPSPRGMDRFAVRIDDHNQVIINTHEVIQGPPIGTDTTGQEAAGPQCIGEVEF